MPERDEAWLCTDSDPAAEEPQAPAPAGPPTPAPAMKPGPQPPAPPMTSAGSQSAASAMKPAGPQFPAPPMTPSGPQPPASAMKPASDEDPPGFVPARVGCRSELRGWAGAHLHGAVRPRRRAPGRGRPPGRWC
jgi:hypothetical protein